MSKNLVYIGIAALAIIAIVLGYKIYQQNLANKIDPSVEELQNQSTPQPVNRQTTPVSQSPQLSTTSEAERQAVLNIPQSNASKEEVEKHSQLVASLSKRSPVLDVTDCRPEPVVLHTTPDTVFTAKNSDATPHTIFYGGHENVIPANGEKALLVKRDFKEGLGLFGYACDGKGVVGIIAAFAQ